MVIFSRLPFRLSAAAPGPESMKRRPPPYPAPGGLPAKSLRVDFVRPIGYKKASTGLEEATFHGIEVEALSKKNRSRPSLDSPLSYQVRRNGSID
jgi:hypothetical protein